MVAESSEKTCRLRSLHVSLMDGEGFLSHASSDNVVTWSGEVLDALSCLKCLEE